MIKTKETTIEEHKELLREVLKETIIPKIEGIEDRLWSIEVVVQGNDRLGVVGLKAQTKEILKKINELQLQENILPEHIEMYETYRDRKGFFKTGSLLQKIMIGINTTAIVIVGWMIGNK